MDLFFLFYFNFILQRAKNIFFQIAIAVIWTNRPKNGYSPADSHFQSLQYVGIPALY